MLQKFIFLKINKNKQEYKWFQEVLTINYSVWWKLYHLESAIVINNLLESNQIYWNHYLDNIYMRKNRIGGLKLYLCCIALSLYNYFSIILEGDPLNIYWEETLSILYKFLDFQNDL